MTYDTPRKSTRDAYEALPTEPRRDEQLDAAESGRTSPCDQTAARIVIVESAAGNNVVTAAAGGSAAHGDGPLASAIQPDGAGSNLCPIAIGTAVHSSESTRSMPPARNRVPSRLVSDSRRTLALNASCSGVPTYLAISFSAPRSTMP